MPQYNATDLFEVVFKLECATASRTNACCQAWKVFRLCHIDKSLHVARRKPNKMKSAASATKSMHNKTTAFTNYRLHKLVSWLL